MSHSGPPFDDNAFFAFEHGLFVPRDSARGFWSGNSLHGHAVTGLIGHEAEHRHGAEGFMPARLSVDMHRLAPFSPVRIETVAIRESRRLKLVDVRLLADEVEVARAQVLFLRTGAEPPGNVWSVDYPEPPRPEDVPVASGEGIPEWFERREIEGTFGRYGPRRIWTRELRPMVEGLPLTPWTRLAAAADFASPWSHSGDAGGIQYINCDVVMHAHRPPVSEWVGLETVLQSASSGIATGACRLFDEQGVLGHVSTTGLANQPRHS